MLERIIGFRVRHAGQRIKKPMAVGKKMFRSIELWLQVYMPLDSRLSCPRAEEYLHKGLVVRSRHRDS